MFAFFGALVGRPVRPQGHWRCVYELIFASPRRMSERRPVREWQLTLFCFPSVLRGPQVYFAGVHRQHWGRMAVVGKLRGRKLLSTLPASARGHPTEDVPLPLYLPRYRHPGVRADASGWIWEAWPGLYFPVNPSRGYDIRGVQLGLYNLISVDLTLRRFAGCGLAAPSHGPLALFQSFLSQRLFPLGLSAHTQKSNTARGVRVPSQRQ